MEELERHYEEGWKNKPELCNSKYLGEQTLK
jgi:hypothetical protein